MGVTPRISLAIEELVLDGVEEGRDAADSARAEVSGLLRERGPEPVAARAEQIAAAIGEAVEAGLRR